MKCCVIVLLCTMVFSIIPMDDVLRRAHEAFETARYKDAKTLYRKCFLSTMYEKHTQEERYWSRINYAETMLTLGKFKKGFEEYDSRLLNTSMYRTSLQKPWNGSSDIQGKTILVRGEHRVGDILFSMRYLKVLKEHGAASIIVQERGFLQLTLARQWYINAVISTPEDEELVPYDYDIYAMSLPRYVSNNGIKPTKSVQDVVWVEKYIEPDPSLVSILRRGMLRDRAFKILIAAYRADACPNGEYRSLQRDCSIGSIMDALYVPGVSFYCTQKGHRPVSRSEYERKQQRGNLGILDKLDVFEDEYNDVLKVVSKSDRRGSFENTAAIMTLVDFVVIVDSSEVMLAVALNIPALGILLPKVSHWRWGDGQSSKTPFFLNAELFWQKEQEDWTEPLAQLAAKVKMAVQDRQQEFNNT